MAEGSAEDGREYVTRPNACAMLGILDDALAKGIESGLYTHKLEGRVAKIGLLPEQIRFRVVPIEELPAPEPAPRNELEIEREVGGEDRAYHDSIAEANRRHGRVAAIAMSAYWQGRYHELRQTSRVRATG